MTPEEKKAELYKIYATLGELSVHKKQSEQRMALINSEIEKYENLLVKTLETPETVEEEVE